MTHDDSLRQRNLVTVREFMTLWGPDRGRRRIELAHPEAKVLVQMSPDPAPGVHDFVWWAQRTAEVFPNYGPTDYELYETEDPNRFIVRTVGAGARIEDDGTETPVAYPYLYGFLMEEGRIRLFEEHVDELGRLWPASGVELTYPTPGNHPR
ncbi:MAG: PhzA/PhzB family protein [Protaetiibacter sp.]